MKKKKIAANIIATVMLMGALSGCDLFVKESSRDMEQTSAKVNITKSEDFQATYGNKYDDIIPELTVKKRDLVAYFVNSGYSYISAGYSYEDTFDTLMTSMVNYKIIIQYAMVYFFENEPETYKVEDYKTFKSSSDDTTYKILEYLLTTGEDEYKEETGVTHYEMAKYELQQSLNSAIDGREALYLASADDEDETDEDDARTTPDGIDTEKDDYCDQDYVVYTGWNNPCSHYEKQSGSNVTTRKKGFAAFLNMLDSNGLLEDDETMSYVINSNNEEGKGLENTAYYHSEMITQMQSILSSKLTDAFESAAEKQVTDEYLASRYSALLSSQTALYDKDVSTFESDIDSLSDSSFVLYCPESADDSDSTSYGFVYNILLPFSTTQSYALSQYQNGDNATDSLGNYTPTYYNQRNALLEQVKDGDLRGDWINGSGSYSYAAQKGEYYDNGTGSNYLFFPNSTKAENADRYEKISKYLGKYPYNGKVEYDEDTNDYKLTANKLSITEFLSEMEGYLNYALDGSSYTAKAYGAGDLKLQTANQTAVTVGSNGYTTTYMNGDIITKNSKGETTVDYSKFVYYVGQIADSNGKTMTVNANQMFKDSSTNYAYKAMSAFNELQFAYSTDTGCLNTYLGYNVSRYSTSFVGEFEYAAKLAISLGVGTYTVCPSDYGWHIIYCTYVFNKGEQYSPIWANKTEEDTFEYYYYEALKSGIVSEYQTRMQNQTVNIYNNDSCVTIYEKTYEDYTSLKNTTSDSSNS